MNHPYRPAPKSPRAGMNAWLEYARWWLHGRAFTSVFEPIFYAVVVILIFVVVMGIQGCTDPARQIQARAADSVAQAANSALPILIERYRQDGFRALDKLKAAGGTADDVPATLDAVRAKWKPVWDAWKALVVAQDAWADALEGGGNPTAAVTALKDAYCGLRGVWPEDIPAVPLAPVKCPE